MNTTTDKLNSLMRAARNQPPPVDEEALNKRHTEELSDLLAQHAFEMGCLSCETAAKGGLGDVIFARSDLFPACRDLAFAKTTTLVREAGLRYRVQDDHDGVGMKSWKTIVVEWETK